MPTPFERFSASLDDEGKALLARESAASMGDELGRWIEAAKARWPRVAIDDGDFAAHVATLVGKVLSIGELFEDERGADLYLAFACARGDASALRHFETHFLRHLTVTWRGRPATLDDDARQELRERLLVPRKDGKARIASYAGRGTLRNWVRVSALRQLADASSNKEPEVALDDQTSDSLAGTGDGPQTTYMKALYRAELEEALKEASSTLSERDRTILRYALIGRLSIDELAIAFAAHRATAARWLADARESFARELRKSLGARLGVDDDEVDNILQLLDGQVDLALGRYLRE